MNIEKRPGFWKRDDRFARLAGVVILALMMVCIVVSITQMGQAAFPEMHGAYLVGLSFLVALEAIASLQMLDGVLFPEKEWWVYHGSELVVIMLAVKLAFYAQYGFGRLMADVPLWAQDFQTNFFTLEYGFGVLTMAFIWVFSRQISGDLAILDREERILRQEVEAAIYENLEEVRERLIGALLSVGVGMIILAALLRSEPVTRWARLPVLRASVANLLVYFLLALALLSLTQFSLMRANWMRQRLKIGQQVSRRWLLYSVILVAGLAIVSRLLPTGYSIGPLEILNYLLYLLVLILNLIMFLLITPFLYVMTWFLKLFKTDTPVEPLSGMPALIPPAATHTGSVPLLELLKSILFWVGLVVIVGYSVYYYVHERQDLLRSFRKLPFYSWLDHFLGWLARLLDRVQRQVSTTIHVGLQRIRARRPGGSPPGLFGYLNLGRLSARQKILFYYLAMVRRGGEVGPPREPSQTPYEYSQSLSRSPGVKADQGLKQDIELLTDEFVEARYSLHPVSAEEVGLVQRCWARVRKALRRSV